MIMIVLLGLSFKIRPSPLSLSPNHNLNHSFNSLLLSYQSQLLKFSHVGLNLEDLVLLVFQSEIKKNIDVKKLKMDRVNEELNNPLKLRKINQEIFIL